MTAFSRGRGVAPSVLIYRCSHAAISVNFKRNSLAQAAPLPTLIGGEELSQ